MEKIQIQITDADYEVENGEVTVRCFGKTGENEDIVFYDRDFLPYLYVLPKPSMDLESLKDDIENTQFVEENEPLPVENVEKKQMVDLNKERPVLKVYTTIPAKIPKLKNKLWELEAVEECREFDIPFYRRYLIDNKIRPASWAEIEGEKLEPGEFDLRIEAKSVENIDKETEIAWETVAFDLEVYQNRIIMASFYGKGFQKVLTTEEIDRDFVETVESEKRLIERMVEIVDEREIDILTGYNTDEFDFDVLRERSNEHNVTLSMGMDGERMKFNRRGRFKGARLKGKMHLDLYPFIEHVISPGLDSETLDLDSVADEMLGLEKDDLSWEQMKESWREKKNLETFADYSLKDSELAFKLAEELVPQILELSKIVGLIPFDACRLTYGQLTENYLLREAYNRDMLALNRPSQDARQKRRRQGAYSGGFVYTPDPGLYENIVVLDFKSLYPTVMVAHNISPDTLNLEECDNRFELDEFDYDFCQDEQGFFPELVEGLVEDRSKIKENMSDVEKDTAEYNSLDNRQQAEKILANSVGPGAHLIVKDPENKLRVLSIEEFYKAIKSEEKDINGSKCKDVEGWEALSVKEDKAVFKPVYAATQHEPEDAYRIKTRMGEVTATGDHSLISIEGEANNRIRDSKFDSLQEVKSSKISEDDVIAQVNDLDLGSSRQEIIVPKLLKDCPEEFYLYIPKSENLEKRDWYKRRVDIIDAVLDGRNSAEINEDSDLGDKTLRKAIDEGLIDKKQVVGSQGNTYECKVTQKGEAYRDFYDTFKQREKNSRHYLISLEDIEVLPPRDILESSFVANKSGRARNKIPAVFKLTEEFASILGWFVAEGHVRVDGTEEASYMDLGIASDSPEQREQVQKLFESVFNYESSINGRQVTCSTSTIARIFSKLCGNKADQKKVPKPIFNCQKNVRESFLHSYSLGDGDENGRRFSTISKELQAGLSTLLKEEECILHNGYDTDTYRVSRRTKTQGEKIVSGDLYGQKPVSVNETEKPEKVYDLSVRDTEKFVTAEGLVLHNSFYGYLGYNGARWYSRESAEATTYLGRMHIQETIEKAEEEGFEVVYGDSLDYSRQIVVRNPEGETCFMKIGEFVEEVEEPQKYETLAFDIENEEAVFKSVKRAIEHSYKGDLIRFDTSRGRTEVTPQHSVYKFEDGEIKLGDAETLQEGDKLVSLTDTPVQDPIYTPGKTLDITELGMSSDLRAYTDKRSFPERVEECPYCGKDYYLSTHVSSKHSDRKVRLVNATEEHRFIGSKNAGAGKIPRYWELSEDFAWVLGFYCGDGSASNDKKHMISFGGQKEENIRKVKSFFDDILEDDLKIIENTDDRTGNKMYYYRVQRKSITEFFINGLGIGKGSESKKVPNIILNADECLKAAFVEGYTEADGSIEREIDERYNSKSIRYSSKSSFLSNQVHYILKQLKSGENRYGREINDVSYKYRSDKPKIKCIRNTAAQKPVYNGWSFTPAKINNKVEIEPEKQKVYDIEVEGQHNFVDAEGLILVHNTDSVLLKADNVREKMDSFLNEVNAELPRFMQLEFEGFFTRGFFTSTDSGEGAKKKYALLDEEGKMKITGFEQVRRDWSPIAKQTQKKVLREVLEDDVDAAAETVKTTIERLKDGEVPVEDLRIYTSLTKEPEEYGSKAPHVEAAKRAKKRGEDISPGETISYVITRGAGTISDRAEIVKYADDYDADYYIENQVIPVTLRVLKVFGYTEGQLKGKGKQSGLGRFS